MKSIFICALRQPWFFVKASATPCLHKKQVGAAGFAGRPYASLWKGFSPFPVKRNILKKKSFLTNWFPGLATWKLFSCSQFLF
ncbi:hypothetical protein SCG7109_BG_00090 [Chlamydiales bacterium SCGC AG-110-M15]|nr:hypothetical protein SCG7109_BG_00090 [Chlamydiales bacterium SCGC AG-110-M15]